jgi:hypothetical protein
MTAAAGGVAASGNSLHNLPLMADQPLSVVADHRISESSGLAASREHRDCLWVHNDSGDKPRLFLIDTSGQTRCVVDVKGASAVDWEDMCSFEIDSEPWLLIADVGDNQLKRGSKASPCRLYLLKEPKVDTSNGTDSTRVDIEITLTWANGPVNCESVAVDVRRREILLLDKSSPFRCQLYRIPLDLSDDKQKHVAVPLGSVAVPFATAIDVSPDSNALAVATMWSGVLYRKAANESWKQALSRTAVALPLPRRRQGETICFSTDGQSLFLNSEGPGEPLWRISVPPSGPR